MRCSLQFLILGAVLGSSTASAQNANWITSVFPDRAHDFGTVARGSKIRHSFKLINTTNQDIHIADWRTKCGCTEVRIGARDIPPGTQTVVEAVLDTTKFVGYKPSGLTLILDRPFYQEVDLNLSCFIRGDVTLNPGVVDFGVTPRVSKQNVMLTLTYAGGRPGWKVNEIVSISPHVTAKLTELNRTSSTVQYQLVATLNSTVPSGYFKDEFTLKTNDPASPNIPVSVVANVQAAVIVTPSIINLGRVKPGETVQRRIQVRSAQPFKITDAKSQKPELTVEKLPADSKLLHSLVISLKAPTQLGGYNTSLEISTDLKDEPPGKMTAFATIAP